MVRMWPLHWQDSCWPEGDILGTMEAGKTWVESDPEDSAWNKAGGLPHVYLVFFYFYACLSDKS